MEKQKYLIQKFPEKGFGLLYLWTPTLSKRDDMKPYDGEVPESMRISLVDAQPVAVAPSKALFQTNMDDLAGPGASQPVSAVPGGSLVAADSTIVALGDAAGGVVLKSESGVADDAKAPKANDDTDGDKTAEGQDLTPVLTPEQKHAKLIEIIGKWTPGDPENFTTAGLPRLDSLMSALGADVEGRERDAAWQAFCALHQTKK